MQRYKRIALVLGVITAAAIPTSAALTSAQANTIKVGTPDCYVEIDDGGVEVTFGGTRPPFVGTDSSGTAGAGAHCPLR